AAIAEPHIQLGHARRRVRHVGEHGAVVHWLFPPDLHVPRPGRTGKREGTVVERDIPFHADIVEAAATQITVFVDAEPVLVEEHVLAHQLRTRVVLHVDRVPVATVARARLPTIVVDDASVDLDPRRPALGIGPGVAAAAHPKRVSRLHHPVPAGQRRGEVPWTARTAVARAASAGRSVVADAAARRQSRRSARPTADGRQHTDASPASPQPPPAESFAEQHGLPRYRGVRSNRKTLNSGPVTGAGDRAIPIGGGGGTAVIGRLIEPPSYLPPAAGAPNRSCTFRTA